MIWSRTAAVLLAVNSLLLCGCPNKPAANNKSNLPSFRGQEVELVAPASFQLPAVWEVALQEWMNQSGATVRWTEYDPQSDSLVQKLADPIPVGGRVILFPLRELSAIDRHLAPLPSGAGIDFNDLFKGLRDRVISRNRSPVAIPIAAPEFLCYYRADLLRKAGLKPPETWDDYQVLLDSLDKWAPGLTAVEPLAPDSRAALLFARSLAYVKHPENYSVWFDLESGQPVLETPGFQAAVESASHAWKKMPSSISDLTPLQARHQILEGKAALAIGAEPTMAAKDIVRAESIEIGVSRLPGSRRVYNTNSKRWDSIPASGVHGPTLSGFDGWAIGVGSTEDGKSADAALNLLASLAGDQFESNWASLPKTPCRESQVTTAASWHESGLTLEEASKSVDAVALTLRDNQVVADLPIPKSAQFRKATNEVIARLLKDELDATAAVHQLQIDFAAIVKDIGADIIRADYRRGLGLPALNSPENTK
jgi:ABC-type glycerol-3-phosphate transport system substrate-binding protein